MLLLGIVFVGLVEGKGGLRATTEFGPHLQGGVVGEGLIRALSLAVGLGGDDVLGRTRAIPWPGLAAKRPGRSWPRPARPGRPPCRPGFGASAKALNGQGQGKHRENDEISFGVHRQSFSGSNRAADGLEVRVPSRVLSSRFPRSRSASFRLAPSRVMPSWCMRRWMVPGQAQVRLGVEALAPLGVRIGSSAGNSDSQKRRTKGLSPSSPAAWPIL